MRNLVLIVMTVISVYCDKHVFLCKEATIILFAVKLIRFLMKLSHGIITSELENDA